MTKSDLSAESSRRDDIVLLGHMLLYLLHGRLPWQGIFAPSREAKVQRMGEMKRPDNRPMTPLLAQSPPALSGMMRHAYQLQFAQKPDYAYLRALLERTMYENGWRPDGCFDWLLTPDLSTSNGTLIPWEYKFLYDPGRAPPSARPMFDSAGTFVGDCE